ncbi:hypothetical protein FRC17_005604 [Serendipita sp. 399]|nr:hypothetical protein FRC17_005604 [Serendipita sp. 399]
MGKVSQPKTNNRYSPVLASRVQPRRKLKRIALPSAEVKAPGEYRRDGWTNSLQAFKAPLEHIPALRLANTDQETETNTDTESVIRYFPTEEASVQRVVDEDQGSEDVEMFEGRADIAEEPPSRKPAEVTSSLYDEGREQQSRMPSPEWFPTKEIETTPNMLKRVSLRDSARGKATRVSAPAPMGDERTKKARTPRTASRPKRDAPRNEEVSKTKTKKIQVTLAQEQTSGLQPRARRRRKEVPPSDRVLRSHRP